MKTGNDNMEQHSIEAGGTSRRTFLTGMAAAAGVSITHAWGQAPAAPALPLKNLGLEHLDIVVPDTAASAKFYMRLFKTKLHQQPFN